MFQGLSQGASVHVFYRNEPRIVSGKVVSSSTHMPTYNPNQPMSMFNGLVTDITVQVGNDTLPFAGLPANGVVADFPSKGLFLATDISAIYKEIDTSIAALEQDLATVPSKQQLLASYKSLRTENNPEAKREQDFELMRDELSEMRKMLSTILAAKQKEE